MNVLKRERVSGSYANYEGDFDVVLRENNKNRDYEVVVVVTKMFSKEDIVHSSHNDLGSASNEFKNVIGLIKL